MQGNPAHSEVKGASPSPSTVSFFFFFSFFLSFPFH